MALYDIESEDGSYSADEFAEYEDRESLRRSRQALGISVDYVPTWTLRDGFREFFQNWFVAKISFINACLTVLGLIQGFS